MPDLITHLCSLQVVRQFVRVRHLSVVMLGVILPDIISRPLHIFFPATYWYMAPLHSPLVCLLYCLLVSLLWAPELRRGVFLALLAGVALHLLFDSMQNQLGPVYRGDGEGDATKLAGKALLAGTDVLECTHEKINRRHTAHLPRHRA
ncbi:MAG: hypothetical protein NT045_02130 [Candidatus Aureabacteria bacterium]|nr:hypothetical protein [Candidatus Auribacterota bacterium]